MKRIEWIRERYDPEGVVYMGDGILDPQVFAGVGYGIAPANAFLHTRAKADYVTTHSGGDRAVAEACVHLLDRFFTPFDPERRPDAFASSGEWGI